MKNTILYITLVIIISTQKNLAQLQTCQWTLNINNISGQIYSSEEIIKVDNAGNIYVYNEIFNDGYQENLILTKINSNGNIIWSKNFGGNGNEIAKDIFFDNNNNIYITGTFNSPTLSFDNINVIGNNLVFNPFTNITDYFITKLDANGNVIWVKSSGANSNNWIVPYICNNIQGCSGVANISKAVDNDGHIYMIGNTLMSSLNINNSVVQNTQNKCFIIKFDLEGNILWSKIIGSNGLILKGIKTDSLGNIFIRGSFSSPSTNLDGIILTNTFSDNNTDDFISKFNSFGNISWAIKISGDVCKYIESFDVNNYGEVAFGGRFCCNINIDNQTLNTISNTSNWDGFIVKLDSNGNINWKKAIGGNRLDYVYGVKLDNEGNIYGIGIYNSFPSLNLDNLNLNFNNNNDIFAVKYNQNGNVIWAINASGSGTDNGYSIDYDNFGNFFIQGTLQYGYLSFCNTNLISNGQIINFLTKYSEVNLGNVEHNLNDNISIYPNPAHTQININFNKSIGLNGGTIRIINSIGQFVLTTPISTSYNNSTMSLQAWGKAGLYFLQIINPQGEIVDIKKIILQ